MDIYVFTSLDAIAMPVVFNPATFLRSENSWLSPWYSTRDKVNWIATKFDEQKHIIYAIYTQLEEVIVKYDKLFTETKEAQKEQASHIELLGYQAAQVSDEHEKQFQSMNLQCTY